MQNCSCLWQTFIIVILLGLLYIQLLKMYLQTVTRLTSRLFVLCSASLVGGESWGNINRDLITLSFKSERSGGWHLLSSASAAAASARKAGAHISSGICIYGSGMAQWLRSLLVVFSGLCTSPILWWQCARRVVVSYSSLLEKLPFKSYSRNLPPNTFQCGICFIILYWILCKCYLYTHCYAESFYGFMFY